MMKHFCSFSEAIREGAKLRPQVKVYLMNEYGTCALGAGLHAMFIDEMAREFELVDKCGFALFEINILHAFPYMMDELDRCPHRFERRWWQFWRSLAVCTWNAASSRRLIDTVYHLNDCHGWTREAIADWLEREEEKLGYITLIETELVSTPEAVTTPVLAAERAARG